MQKIIIYTDGGARGNPGHAAIGVVIGDSSYSEYIGHATNNVAEYRAIIFALKKSGDLLGENKKSSCLEIRSDSELIVNQMSGIYKIKNENLKDLFLTAKKLVVDFKQVIFVHIPRDKNKKADFLVNEALDKAGF